MRTYTFKNLMPRDGEPVFSRAIPVDAETSAALTVVIQHLEYEDPPGTVTATVQVSSDANNWGNLASLDVDGDARVGTASLTSAIPSQFVRVKASMSSGLTAIMDVELTLSMPQSKTS